LATSFNLSPKQKEWLVGNTPSQNNRVVGDNVLSSNICTEVIPE